MTKSSFPIDFHWPTQEPFLFCVHHNDHYPEGTANFGPNPRLLEGRAIGHDFTLKDGFRMYHGDVVPGFPVHPHRGFETITIVRRGYIDHADSMGAAGRYGEGDVQWMTAGSGVQHSEMFPLLRSDAENPVELFQIWLNLPRKNKMVPPHFKMFWSEKIPVAKTDGSQVTVIAGEYNRTKALLPPPNSWAGEPQNEVTILLVKIDTKGSFVLPKSKAVTARTIYIFDGSSLKLNGSQVKVGTGFRIDSQTDLIIEALDRPAQLLVLQAAPIGEPIAQHGPFVMNDREEIIQAFNDYQKTRFGGWPWPAEDPVHGPSIERFAKFPDGSIEKP